VCHLGGLQLPYDKARCWMFNEVVPPKKTRLLATTAGIGEDAIAQRVVDLITPSLTGIIQKAVASALQLANPDIIPNVAPKHSRESLHSPTYLTARSSQTSLNDTYDGHTSAPMHSSGLICDSQPVASHGSDNDITLPSLPTPHPQNQPCLQSMTTKASQNTCDRSTSRSTHPSGLIHDSQPVASHGSDNDINLPSLPTPHPQNQPYLQSLTTMALHKIRALTGNPTADWTCPEQKEAMSAVLEHKTDVMALMCTGSGKTMLTIVPTLLEDTITVYVLPLKSLMLDVCRNLDDMGLEYEVFHKDSTRISGTKKLVLVSADRTKFPEWHEALAEVNQRVTVGRLVWDEAQLAFTANDYRDALQHLYDLRQFPTMQLILLSGTVQQISEATLIDAFGLAPNTIIIRTPTIRPELQYILEQPRTSDNHIAARVKDILDQHHLDLSSRDRVLIFVPYLDQGQHLAEMLGCEFYNGGEDVTDSQRESIYNHWISGVHQVMICTAAFSAGNNYRHVRLVLHAGTPKEMIGCIQEMSRGGRDHQPAKCYLLPKSPGPPPDIPDGQLDHKGQLAMYKWVFPSTPTCLRFGLTAFCDGVGTSCLDNNSYQRCSICQPIPLPGHTSSHSPHTNSRSSSSTLKRSAASISSTPSTSSLDLAFQTSKRRKTGRHISELQYVDRMRAALEYFRGTCAYCKMYGIKTEPHSIILCPRLLQQQQQPGPYLSWRQDIKYNKDFHIKICFFCHVPQCHDKLHKTFSKDGSACEYPDVVAPVAYAIYNIPNLHSAATSHFKQRWRSLYEFVTWINQQPDMGQRSNLTALTLWYHMHITS